MAKEFKRYLVTSALPYANGPVHIGHLAGVYIPSDIYTRYLRLKGRDVISVCGSDEHGVPITIKARKEGVSPQQIVDRYHELIKRSFEGLGMSFDIYSRTSSPVHAKTASDFFRKLYDEGKFIEKSSMQYYDTEARTFLADRYIVGTCPKCDYIIAVADYVGSTAGILDYCGRSEAREFIVVTEAGILSEMRRRYPDKEFIPAPPDDEACGCNNCKYMKMVTLENIAAALENLAPEIVLDEETRRAAERSIRNMIAIR